MEKNSIPLKKPGHSQNPVNKTNKTIPLDIEYIQEKLDKGYEFTEKAKGREIVLIIGNTGVGKSTTANYLLGHKMKEAKYKNRNVIITEGESTLGIGHEVASETLYAKPVEHSSFPWLLTDCPGFLGNRKVEDGIIESISTELAIRSASQVKGILILISINHLLETRVAELRGLVKTLIALFKDPVDMVKYSTFVITKKYKLMPDEEAREATVGGISAVKDFCDTQIRNLPDDKALSADGLNRNDYETIKEYFTAVLEKQEQIIFVNPLDNGQSKQLIIDRIQGLKPRRGLLKEMVKEVKNVKNKLTGHQNQENINPITINDFNFSKYDENRTKFNKVIYERVHDGHQLISSIRNCDTVVRTALADIIDAEKRIEILEKLKLNLEDDNIGIDQEANRRSIHTWNNIILHNNTSISDKSKRVDEIKQLIETLHEDLSGIDTNEYMVFRQNSIEKYIHPLKLFGWEKLAFEANTGDSSIPITKVEKSCENGKWYDEDDRQGEGIYKITYKSKFIARPAKASVTAYIKTKDDPGNKIRIEEINEDLKRLDEEKLHLEKDISDLEANNEVLVSDIEAAKAGLLSKQSERQAKLDKCKKDIEHYKEQINEKKQKMEQAKIEGINLVKEFTQEQRKFNIVIEIAELLDFPSILVRNFVSDYKIFIKDIANNKFTFDIDSVTDPVNQINQNILSDNDLIDPITGREIRVPVFTQAGTLFDSHSLLEQFDQNDPKPYFFTHKDGKVEEIKYLSWVESDEAKKIIEQKRRNTEQLSTPPTLFFKKITHMSFEQLTIEKDRLTKEIQLMKVELEKREAELEKVERQMANLMPNQPSDNISPRNDSKFTNNNSMIQAVNQFDNNPPSGTTTYSINQNNIQYVELFRKAKLTKSNENSIYVEFNDLKMAEVLQSKLLNVGFGSLDGNNDVKREIKKTQDGNYVIELTEVEYNALIGNEDLTKSKQHTEKNVFTLNSI